MRTRSILLAVCAAAAVLVLGPSVHAEPSYACDAGEVPPTTTPAGVGVATFGAPPSGTQVQVCNSGAAVPAPAQVKVYMHPTAPRALLVVDGDSTFRDLPCSDGFVGVMVDAGGPMFFYSPDGDHAAATPSKSPEAFATDAAGCVPA